MTALLQGLPFVNEAKAVENKLVVTLDDPEERNPEIIRALVGAGADVQFVGELRHSLEEVYLRLMERTLIGISMNKIKTIIHKEWAEVFKNRMVLFTVAFMPLIFTALPLVILYTMRGETGMNDVAGDLPEQFSSMCPADLPAGECFQVYMVSQFMIMFMIIPGSSRRQSLLTRSWVRKPPAAWNRCWQRRSLPSSCWLGKSLAAAIPGIGATYGCLRPLCHWGLDYCDQ